MWVSVLILTLKMSYLNTDQVEELQSENTQNRETSQKIGQEKRNSRSKQRTRESIHFLTGGRRSWDPYVWNYGEIE